MYTKEDLQKIIKEFTQLDFYHTKVTNRQIRVLLNKVNQIWPDLISSPKVLRYWLTSCEEDGFIDSLFCKNCSKFMNNRANGSPLYCSKECRQANHNWSKNSEKRKQLEDRWEQKYGYRNPLSSKEVREKIEQTNIKRYGTKHVWNKESFCWLKIKETNKHKYGTDYVVQSKYFKNKAKKTCLEHYGVESPMKSEEVKDKVKKTNLERYGVENVRCSGSPILDKIKQDCLKRYGVPYYCMTEQCKSAMTKLVSKVNLKFADKLKEAGFSNIEFEKQIGWYSYDLYINGLLIDINPSFTHSVTAGLSQFKPKSVRYHEQRLQNAKVHNYPLLQIWDWDNWDKIINFINVSKLVLIEDYEVKEVSLDIAKNFIQKYSILENSNDFSIGIGLYSNGRLVALITFRKTKDKKLNKYELTHSCSRFNCFIVDGYTKALSYFESKYKPQRLIATCDLSKNVNEFYEQLGFTSTLTYPLRHWYNLKTKQHFTETQLKLTGARKLLDIEPIEDIQDEELMRLYGFIEVYDAGQTLFRKQYNN